MQFIIAMKFKSETDNQISINSLNKIDNNNFFQVLEFAHNNITSLSDMIIQADDDNSGELFKNPDSIKFSSCYRLISNQQLSEISSDPIQADDILATQSSAGIDIIM